MVRLRRPPPGPAGLGPPLRSWSVGPGEVEVVVLVYDGVTTADIVMPGEVLADTLQATVTLVAARPGSLVGVEPSRPVVADVDFDGAPEPQLLLVPGGIGWRDQADDATTRRWLRDACRGAAGVLSVSTGPLLLAAAGLLDGEETAGHWLGLDHLAALGADPVSDRVQISHDGRWVTAAGAVAAATEAGPLADRVRLGPTPAR